MNMTTQEYHSCIVGKAGVTIKEIRQASGVSEINLSEGHVNLKGGTSILTHV